MNELTACSTGITLGPLAKGLVEATPDQTGLWDKLVASFRLADSAQRSPEFLACYLLQPPIGRCGAHRRTFDRVPKRPMLTEWFPYFQNRVTILRPDCSASRIL